jgi:RNA polymerase sigma factor (sigma-70 family)
MLMKDYRVEIKVKNNYLFSLMKSYEITNIAELSRATGISVAPLHDFINLKRTPHTKHGRLLPSVEMLCSFFSCTVEDLFPPQHIEDALEKNAGAIEANMTELVSSNLNSALEMLNERQRTVIEMRFGLDGEGGKTLDEAGEMLGISKVRVRQIEAKALRILRGRGSSDLAYAYDEGWGESKEACEREDAEMVKKALAKAEMRRMMEELQKEAEAERIEKEHENYWNRLREQRRN